jgi:hypothetical protein
MARAKDARSILRMGALALLATTLSAAADGEEGVRAIDLATLTVSGKVGAVLWTVRADNCTLQVVFPSRSQLQERGPEQTRQKRERPAVQIWLLKGDGTVIAPVRRADVGPPDLLHPYGIEIAFAFPRSVENDAVAVAMRVDDVFKIQALNAP